MDDLSDLLSPQAVTAGVTVQSKKMLFQHLATLGSRLTGLPAEAIADRLWERERLGSTGFGGGIAIPHGKIAGLSAVTGVFVRLNVAVDCDAIDGLPVDLLFMLLSPSEGGTEHLKALARVSRRLRDRAFVAKLRGAGSPDALYALFAGDASRHAA